jgi:hypothetical protein
MDQLGLQRMVPGQMGDAFRKKNETVCVVRVIRAVRAVERGPVVEFRPMDKVNRDPFTRLHRPEFRPMPLLSQRQVDVIVQPAGLWKSLANPAVKRSDDAHLVPCPAQRLGQRRDHIGETATLGIGMNFAARQQESHRGRCLARVALTT